MSRRKRKTTLSESEARAWYVAAQLEKAMQAFVVAGAQVLSEQFSFDEPALEAWTVATVKRGSEYLAEIRREAEEFSELNRATKQQPN